MPRYHLMIFAFVTVLSVPTSAAGDFAAEFAGQVFFSACINSKGNTSGYWLGEYKFVPLPTEKGALFLQDAEGQAWSSLMAPGNLVLTIHKTGLCSVHVRRVNTEAMTKEFTRVINYAWRDKKIEELGSSVSSHPYGESLTRSFLLSEVDGTKQQKAVFTISATIAAPLQALLSITNAP